MNEIILGDTIEELKKLKDNSVDLIFADPPYWMRTTGTLKRYEGTDFDGVKEDWDIYDSNQDFNQFTEDWLRECYRVLKENGSIWVIGSHQNVYKMGGTMQDLGFWFINDVIWHKTNPTPNFMGTRLNNSHETLIWATKSEKSKFTFNYKTAKELNVDTLSPEDYEKGERRQMQSVWRLAVASGGERLQNDEGKKLHSTQKPEALLYRILAISSKVGDLVLDPFGGTMTTGAVAKKMGRNYLMIEREEEYVRHGQNRIDNVIPDIGDIEKAVYDIKPMRVTLTEMIEKEYLIDGEKMFIKETEAFANLTEKGRIILVDGSEMDIHSGAATVAELKSDRVNGFDYWTVERNGLRVPISEIRENYRKDHSKK